MALEFLLSVKIEPWKETRISIPEGANYYKLKSGKIKFFRVNPTPERKMVKIADNACEIKIYMQKHCFNINYGKPLFYDAEGNDLNMDNC